jgi:hypothetical protein
MGGNEAHLGFFELRRFHGRSAKLSTHKLLKRSKQPGMRPSRNEFPNGSASLQDPRRAICLSLT